MTEETDIELKKLERAVMVWDKIYFKNNGKYLLLMKAFVNKEVSGINFQNKFCELYSIDFENSKKLEKTIKEPTTFQPNLKSSGFSGLMSRVFTTCDVFEPCTERRESYELSEKQFKDCIKQLLLEMQRYCDE
jgi:phosphatidate phosphatase PAH1